MNAARRTRNTLKALPAAATVGASINLGIQLANGHATVVAIAFTTLAIVLSGTALADDTRTGWRAIRRHLSHKPGPRFRCAHGNPATWDDGEYEAYFAHTAPQTPAPRNIHPAA